MKKKSLIWISLCAVILLILSSLNNVVGFHSVKSNAIDSPLFQTRTRRATNQQQNRINSQYLGLVKGGSWQFPCRDFKTEQLKKAIDLISKMDDKTFERFTELCIQKARLDNSFSETNNDIIQMLQSIRKQSKSIIFSILNKDDRYGYTSGGLITLCGFWFPGCLIIQIILFIIFYPVMIILNSFTLLWCPSRVNIVNDLYNNKQSNKFVFKD